MSFEPPAGILDIGNATLRVGKLEVAETSGLNQGLQNIVKNDLLITEKETYLANKTWGIKLPTAWVGEFDLKTHDNKYVEFNFYNEGSTSNAFGYTLNFKDTTLTLKYDNGNNLASETIPDVSTSTYKKVNVFFERGVIAVFIDGARVLYFKESDTYNSVHGHPGMASRVASTTGGSFVNIFIEADGSDSAVKDLRIVNGRFISDKTSNVSFIGSLGVGVNNPKESLDIRGNMHLTRVSNVSQVSVDSNVVTEYTGPHDRPLRKYPEVALTANSDSGYVASTNNKTPGTGGVPYRDAFMAYDGSFTSQNATWQTLVNSYDSNGDDVNGDTFTVGGTNYVGHWNKLQLPNPIKVDKIEIIAYVNGTDDQRPDQGAFLGSTDGTNWELIYSFSSGTLSSWSASGDASGIRQITTITGITNTNKYNYLTLVVEKIPSSSTATQLGVAEIRYYGHEEGDASLDTTLKTVYNVPATTGTQLEVYYDAKDLVDGAVSTASGAITGLGGTTINGTAFGDPQVSNGAFVFDGTGDAIQTAATSFTGNAIFTASLWVKLDRVTDSTSQNVIFSIGYDGTRTQSGLRVHEDTGKFRFYTQSGTGSLTTDVTAVTNTWYHLNLVHNGSSGYQLYINGEMVGESFTDDLNLASNSTIGLGAAFASSGTINSGTLPFKGSIANFRLYSKVLNADQVKELYDYQKDYFLGSKSQVTLYKGHLGVGVTEPSGQLELAGDERIQEYPPRAMTGYETLVEGHGVFCASASSYYNATQHLPWQAFTPAATSGTADGWNSGDNSTGTGLGYYAETASGEATSAAALFEGTRGEWVQLKCPYPIIVKKFAITGRSNGVYGGSPEDQPKSGILYGSNDGNNWDILANFSGLTYGGASGGAGASGGTELVEVNATKGYTRLVLQATARVTNYGTDDWINIGQLKFFGTPGPTTLDKGSLSLTRSLDVPRVSRYDEDTETPRPEKLLVDFDTTVNSSPTDISGKGNHGAYYNGASYSPADRAFEFDNTQGGIRAQTTNFDTSGKHSFVAWMKFEDFGRWYGLYGIGTNDNSASNFTIYTGTGASGTVGNTGFRLESRGGGRHQDLAWTPVLNTWVHVAVTWDGTGGLNNVNMYIDLVKLERQQLGTYENNPTSSITLPSTQAIRVGADARQFDGAGTGSNFEGQISNPKFYSEVLEFSEIKKLYNLGRTGRSMVISDTAVGIGKAPEAQLDVRGLIKAAAMHIPNTVVQVRAAVLTGDTSTKDVNSGHRNSFVKLNITPRFKNSIILFDFKFLVYIHGGSGAANGASCIVRRHSGDPAALTLTGTNVYLAGGGHNLHYYVDGRNPTGNHIYIALMGLDTPNTLEEIYYVMAFRPYVHDDHTISIGNGGNQPTSVRLMEIAQ